MKTIRGRVLSSYAIFGILLLLLAFFTYKFLSEADKTRSLQKDILAMHGQVLTLIDMDVEVRTEGIYDSLFFNDTSFDLLLKRDALFTFINDSVQAISAKYSTPLMTPIASRLDSVLLKLNEYNILNQEMLEVIQKRGFRDEGLEGEMRSYAHALEKYPNQIELGQLLSLRRREKDYFLRNDPVYVQMLNQECAVLLKSLDPSRIEDQKVKQLLEKYQSSFNEIVRLEGIIGDLKQGLLFHVNQSKDLVLSDLSQLSVHVNEFSNRRVTIIFNRLIILLLVGLVLTSIIGITSANLVSSSIKGLAISMRKSIRSNFKTPLSKPNKFATVETKSLYKDYGDLHATICQQLGDLETSNTQLTKNNKSLNELIHLLRESEDNLKASNELKDKFFSIIAHDLKGPMATNTMLLEYMNTKTNQLSKKEIKLYTNKLYQTSSSILFLLENLLQWASSQSEHLKIHKETFNVTEIVESILKLNKQHTEVKQLNIKNNIPIETSIHADKNMMALVFRNLIDNAIKYTPNEGTITLTCKEEAGMILFHISDTGIGMSEEQMANLFRSLSKKQTSGTNGEKGIGLGLVIAYDFTQKNGGQLEVSSKPQIGSTFTLRLPHPTKHDQPLGSEKILVAEDSNKDQVSIPV